LRSAAASGARERRGCSGNPVCGAGARLLHPSLPSSPQQCRRAGAPIAAARARRAARLALWGGATTRAVARPAPSPAARWWQKSEAAGGGNWAQGASEAPGFKSGCQPGHGRARPRRPGSAQPLTIFALSQRPHGRLVGGRGCQAVGCPMAAPTRRVAGAAFGPASQWPTLRWGGRCRPRGRRAPGGRLQI